MALLVVRVCSVAIFAVCCCGVVFCCYSFAAIFLCFLLLHSCFVVVVVVVSIVRSPTVETPVLAVFDFPEM